MRRIWRFIRCLFDAHDLEHHLMSDWRVCRDCGEVRVTESEFEYLMERRG